MSDEPLSKSKADLIDYHVAKILRKRRLTLGISQQELADAVNVSVQQIQKYEKATNRISCSRLYSFAKLLGVSVSRFFEGLNFNHTESSEYFSEEQEMFEFVHPSEEREIITLVKSFTDIDNLEIRKKVLDLLRSLSSGLSTKKN